MPGGLFSNSPQPELKQALGSILLHLDSHTVARGREQLLSQDIELDRVRRAKAEPLLPRTTILLDSTTTPEQPHGAGRGITENPRLRTHRSLRVDLLPSAGL